MLKKITSYYTTTINKGIEHVFSEFDKRAVRLLNLIALSGIFVILPTVFVKKMIDATYEPVSIILLSEVIFIAVIYLNAIGKNQISCLLFIFSINILGSVAVFLEAEQIEVPFITLSIGCFSIFLLKNKTLRIVSFLFSFATFSILHYIQLTQKEFGLLGYFMTLVVLIIFSIGLWFVNVMRNKNEKTILTQNDTLKHQNEVIKKTSEQLIQLEKEKYEQELLLKQKDIEMILTNNQVQTQLNQNIIKKLKSAQQNGELEKNIRQIILELRQQNDINAKMKINEQDLEVVNASFFENLLKVHPNITRTDKEFCSYIKLGLSTKEIAVIRNTTINTVNVAKTRLRKKMGLDSNQNIAAYLATF